MQRSERRKLADRRRALDWTSALVLSLAGVLSAWTGYQAALFDGQQSAAYAQAASWRTRASEASTHAGQLAQVDAQLFVTWASAYAGRNSELEAFVRERYRPEFKAAFEAWVELKPQKNSTAPATPFQMPQYRLVAAEQSRSAAIKADELLASGDLSDARSDFYQRTGIGFALALFLAGIAQQFKNLSVRAAVLGLAGAFVLAGMWVSTTLPIARAG